MTKKTKLPPLPPPPPLNLIREGSFIVQHKEVMQGSLCGWCRYVDKNICTKFNKNIEPVEVEHTFGNKIYLLPSALRCKECMEEK